MLLSSLKSQMVFCGGIAIGSIIPATLLKPEKETGFIVFASIMLAVFNLAIFLISAALWRNRENLSHPNIKNQIGALYELHDATRPLVGTYSVIFLLRRSFFVMITFLMYSYPSLQIEIMLYSTLA